MVQSIIFFEQATILQMIQVSLQYKIQTPSGYAIQQCTTTFLLRMSVNFYENDKIRIFLFCSKMYWYLTYAS